MLKMDLDEWEFISDDAFLELYEDEGQKFFPRTYVKDSSKSVFNRYFDDTSSSKSQQFVEKTDLPRLPKQLVPFPVEFQPNTQENHDQEHVKQVIIEDSSETRLVVNAITEEIKSPASLKVDQDFVPRVVFKKMNENDYGIDIKVESPKSGSRGVVPQIEANKFQFEETPDDQTVETMTKKDQEHDAVNMWKWSLTGVGAICSFGVAAAATICIIILGNSQQQRKHQKLQFKIYADDKIKEVVNQTSRLNDAMSAARGLPIARAHITYGGYYDGF
ncbi:uncharacterized protein LOC141690298 isoform X2 [Apium graveolens]|uniref:uncharacterized protein LOC141690298 isoform X2 n=1 Tax=Apium graveolens TaxID=4045 RepID=UPI003D799BFF